MSLFHKKKPILFQYLTEEEDLINNSALKLLSKVNEIVFAKDLSPVLILFNLGRSHQDIDTRLLDRVRDLTKKKDSSSVVNEYNSGRSYSTMNRDHTR